MAAATRGQDALVTEINVTPLVDIMLVLLIIFMLTSTTIAEMDRPDVIDVDLPTAASAESTARPPLSVVIKRDGALMLDGAVTTAGALKARVKQRLAGEQGLTAVLSADQSVPHGQVVGVIDALRLMGVKDVAVNTRKQTIE